MRLKVACPLAGLLVLLLPGMAVADLTGSPEQSKTGVGAVIEERAGESGVSEASEVVDDGKVWVTWLVLRENEGDPCIGRDGALMERDSPEIAARLADQEEQFERSLTDAVMNDQDVQRCDERELEDPLEVIRRVVEEELPDIDVQVQPPGGEALVGWDVYLTLGRAPTFQPEPRTVSLLSTDVQVTIDGTATTEVDWDDGPGSVRTYEATRGVAWQDRHRPDATPVTHLYQDTGDRTITVTDTWQVQVDATGVGQWALTIPRESVEVPLRVIETQAVVTAQD